MVDAGLTGIWARRGSLHRQQIQIPTDGTFSGGGGVDGHQDRASETTETLSPSDSPGHAKFIFQSVNNTGDWRDPKNNNLWQGLNGVNNPCPAGFRVPTQPEWNALFVSAKITNSMSAYKSKLKLQTGSLSRALSYSPLANAYWTSSPDKDSTSAYYVYISNNDVRTVASGRRTSDFAIRCIDNGGEEKLYDVSEILEFIQSGKTEEAKSVLMAQYGTLAVDDQTLFNAWNDAKQYDVLALILEARVAKDPDNVQTKVSVAAAYKEMGRFEDAVTLLREIGVSHPEHAGKMSELILQVQSESQNTPTSTTVPDETDEERAARIDQEQQIEAGKSMTEYSEYIKEHYPIINELPIKARLYVIDTGKDIKDANGVLKFTLYVDMYESQENLQPYIEKEITSRGYKLSDYNIVYVDKRY
jgi:tetratricopeptide (TPR) repeat protein